MSVSSLYLRHLVRPFKHTDSLEDRAVPIGEVLRDLESQLADYKVLKQKMASMTENSSQSAGTQCAIGADDDPGASRSSS